MSKWLNEPNDIKDYLGFVYRIYRKSDLKEYIGQKKFWFKETKYLSKKPTKVEAERLNRYQEKGDTTKYKSFKKKLTSKYKGKKNKIKSLYASDWETYNSSSTQLQKEISKLGEDAFEFEMLHHCINKAEMNYLELYEQVQRGCLLRKDSFNGLIRVYIAKKGLNRLQSYIDKNKT